MGPVIIDNQISFDMRDDAEQIFKLATVSLELETPVTASVPKSKKIKLPFGMSDDIEPDKDQCGANAITEKLGFGVAKKAPSPLAPIPTVPPPIEPPPLPPPELPPPEALLGLGHIPSGERVGITGIMCARFTVGRCFVCVENRMPPAVCEIGKGEMKFQFRKSKGRMEQSLHVACVKNRNILAKMTAEHLEKSRQFVNRADISMWEDVDQVHLDEAFTVLQTDMGAASSSSSSAGVPPTVV